MIMCIFRKWVRVRSDWPLIDRLYLVSSLEYMTIFREATKTFQKLSTKLIRNIFLIFQKMSEMFEFLIVFVRTSWIQYTRD